MLSAPNDAKRRLNEGIANPDVDADESQSLWKWRWRWSVFLKVEEGELRMRRGKCLLEVEDEMRMRIRKCLLEVEDEMRMRSLQESSYLSLLSSRG